jgi:hypothetical protein
LTCLARICSKPERLSGPWRAVRNSSGTGLYAVGERLDGSEPGISRRRGVAVDRLDVLEKRAHQRRIELREREG